MHQNANAEGGVPKVLQLAHEAQSTNPLLKIAAGAPKVRTLCSKWQLEHPKFEPFAQSGSWIAQTTNPLLEWKLERPNYAPFARNGSWSYQNPPTIGLVC